MGIYERFDGFLNNIKLTDIQKLDGQAKRESVCAALNYEYYGSTSGTFNSRYVGSWDKLTRIRPPRDVDVLFVLPDSVYYRYEYRAGNKQSQLLQEVKSVLLKSFPNTNIRGDGPVVMVPFASYAVELLPAFKISSGQYRIAHTSAGGKYTNTDPEAEVESVRLSNNATSGNTRDLVRMIKCWQAECVVPMKSFWLELLAIDFLLSWNYAGKSKSYYDWMVRDFFSFLVGKAGSCLIVPGTYEVIWIGDAWKTKAESARERANKAVEFENGETRYPYLALAEWRKIFGNYIS